MSLQKEAHREVFFSTQENAIWDIRAMCRESRQSLEADLVYGWGFMLALGLTKLGKDIRNLFFTKQYNQECDFHRLPDYSDSLLGIEKGQNFEKVLLLHFLLLLDSGPKLPITLTSNYTDCPRLSVTMGISYARCRALCSQLLLWIPLILESILTATARGGRAHIKREKVIMDVSARSTSQRYGLRHLFITDSFSCCFVI